MSQARIGKTIMSILGVYNVRHPQTGAWAVNRVLYTTTNSAKYEVEQELKRRTDLDLNIVVVDTKEGREEKILEAIELAKDKTRNIVLIANYESVYDHPDLIKAFAPDAHIIDEVENLKAGDDAKRAPVIFGIPAKYRVGISARPVINDKDVVVELLLWARHHTFLPPGKDKQQARAELEAKSEGDLFAALDPVKVRWRRKVVMPEVQEPIKRIEYIDYSPEQEEIVLEILYGDFVRLKKANRRMGATDKDHHFPRIYAARQAGVDLGLVKEEAVYGQYMDVSPKIQWLDRFIADEISKNGKVVVSLSDPEEINRLAKPKSPKLREDPR